MNAHPREGKMKSHRMLFGLFGLSAIVVMLLSGACAAPAAQEVPAAAPAAQEAPAAAPEPTKPPEQPPESQMPPVPPPVTCNPANPVLEPVKMVKGPETGRYGEKIYTVVATYTNSKLGQEFLLAVSSGQPEELVKVVENLKICYEVLDTGVPDTSEGKGDTSDEEDLKWTMEFLDKSPYNTVFEFQLTKADIKPENEVVAHFFVDPTYWTLDADRTDDFKSKCSKSASISVGVYNNSAQAELFRGAVSKGRTNIAVPGATPTPVSHNNGAVTTTYDARVYGPGGTSYWVNGTWYKGSGTLCP